MSRYKRLLVTGCSGLIGSEAVLHFSRSGWDVLGVDNNQREQFFGPAGDTSWNLRWLQETVPSFRHVNMDIRDRAGILKLFSEQQFSFVIHCAAQPSHDLAASIPFDDFDVNAVGTLNLLESCRRYCAESPFVFLSTNKVYGDAPNEMELVETPSRFEYARSEDYFGVNEQCRIDRCLHSLFGASKTAADVMAQEYGRYFGMPVGIFRAGCLTGSRHSGVQLHGFLSYLVKVAVSGEEYKIIGYKGKQVRDNLDARDVASAFSCFYENPRPGEVYNLGGGRDNSISVLEAISVIEDLTGRALRVKYDDNHRRGDHICYISDLRKLRNHFPEWNIRFSVPQVLEEMVAFARERAEK